MRKRPMCLACLGFMLVLVLRLYAWAHTDARRLRRLRRGLTAAAAAGHAFF